jgi:hypothetical protein
MTDPPNDLHSPKSLNTRWETGRGEGASAPRAEREDEDE